MTPTAAYYFGYGPTRDGHYLHDTGLSPIDERKLRPMIPWTLRNMDTGLLVNGQRVDTVTGKVWWTCAKPDWLAFFWWDRSGDSRPASNSGFYVRGFQHTERRKAFEFACSMFPTIIARQSVPLVLQETP